MAHEGGGVAPREVFRNRHQVEEERLRTEIDQLIQQARVLLHGPEPKAKLPPRPVPPAKRAAGQQELDEILERANSYRHEIKKLRRYLEGWDRAPTYLPTYLANERDPMETYNLLAERRKELERLKRNGQGLDRVRQAQRQAVEEQKASPNIEEKLKRAEEAVLQQKRMNNKLQADRQKLTTIQKQKEQEVRDAGKELKEKQSELKRSAQSANPKGGSESQQQKQLRRDIDIITAAVQQDKRKHDIVVQEDNQQLAMSKGAVENIEQEVEEIKHEIAYLQAQLSGNNQNPAGPAKLEEKISYLQSQLSGNNQNLASAADAALHGVATAEPEIRAQSSGNDQNDAGPAEAALPAPRLEPEIHAQFSGNDHNLGNDQNRVDPAEAVLPVPLLELEKHAQPSGINQTCASKVDPETSEMEYDTVQAPVQMAANLSPGEDIDAEEADDMALLVAHRVPQQQAVV